MLWINGKMTDLTKKDAIHKLVDAKSFLERYSNPHDKWTEAINIGIEAIEIVMAQEEQEGIVDKYQKIQKIYETWLADGRMDTHKAISKISEVFCGEDGNVD